MEDFLEIVRQVLVPMFYKESQVSRSLKSKFEQNFEAKQKEFKKNLMNSLEKLRREADKRTLKNKKIREEIREISQKTGVSVGQSQKVINVYLKYYSILTSKPDMIIKELDCPIDNRIMQKFRTKGVKRVALKNMSFDDYVSWQEHLQKEGGMKK